MIHLLFKMPQRPGREVAVLKGADDRLGGEHSALYRCMDSLYPLPVKERCTVPDKQHAVRIKTRHRVIAARVYRFRTVTQHLTAAKDLGYLRVRLEFLKFRVRVYQGIEVVQSGHVTDAYHVVLQPVDPPAAVGFRIRWETERVNDLAFGKGARRYFPKLFYTERIDLIVLSFV